MFRKELKESIRYKFVKDISVILLFSTFALTAGIALNERKMLGRSLITKGQSIATYIAKLSIDPLIMRDGIQLDSIVNVANKDEDILYTIILDGQGKPITSQYASINYQSPRLKDVLAGLSTESELPDILTAINKQEKLEELAVPILTGSDTIGRVIIGMSKHNIRNQIVKTILFVIAINLAVMFTLGFVLFINSKNKVFDPITELARAADRFAKGDLSHPVTIASTGEIQMLVKSFNSMAQDLQKTAASILQAKNDWEESFNTINDAITIQDADDNIVRANTAAVKLLGISPPGINIGKCYQVYHGTEGPPEGCLRRETMRTMAPVTVELFEPRMEKHLEIKALPRIGKDHEIIGLVHVVRDITERKRAEEEHQRLQTQILQAQKMDSIGRFAGGIAHDLNNIISVVIGYSEISLHLPPGDKRHVEFMENIKSAGEKAATLTRQILAFSRRQVLEMKPLNVNDVVGQMEKMIRRLIGEDIVVTYRPAAFLPNIMADASQLEQVILNLAVNARDAMPRGGSLTITTAAVVLDKTWQPDNRTPLPGRYILLSVSDTGMGMTPEVREKIFEPFFTTKLRGKGTGLGLATVYGIVKQHNGFIYVESESGSGTTFRTYFPTTEATETVKDQQGQQEGIPRGKETILIVDDDVSLCRLAYNILQPLGYRLHSAANALEALEVSRSLHETLHLLVTDVVMPDRNGRELAEMLLSERPSTKVLFMSGYTDDIITRHGVLESGAAFLQKPISPASLARKVRQVLDSQDSGTVPTPLLPSGEKLRILIADGDKTSYELTKLYVSVTAGAVDRAENGQAAIDLFQSNPYDLVIMDMLMPVMDGCAAIKKIRSWERRNDRRPTPIIMLSGNNSFKDQQAFIAAGASAAIGKPLNRDTLLQAIDVCFARMKTSAPAETGRQGEGRIRVNDDK